MSISFYICSHIVAKMDSNHIWYFDISCAHWTVSMAISVFDGCWLTPSCVKARWHRIAVALFSSAVRVTKCCACAMQGPWRGGPACCGSLACRHQGCAENLYFWVGVSSLHLLFYFRKDPSCMLTHQI